MRSGSDRMARIVESSLLCIALGFPAHRALIGEAGYRVFPASEEETEAQNAWTP